MQLFHQDDEVKVVPFQVLVALVSIYISLVR